MRRVERLKQAQKRPGALPQGNRVKALVPCDRPFGISGGEMDSRRNPPGCCRDIFFRLAVTLDCPGLLPLDPDGVPPLSLALRGGNLLHYAPISARSRNDIGGFGFVATAVQLRYTTCINWHFENRPCPTPDARIDFADGEQRSRQRHGPSSPGAVRAVLSHAPAQAGIRGPRERSRVRPCVHVRRLHRRTHA
jgi:hypothetical protein